MTGAVAMADGPRDDSLRAASWLDRPRGLTDVACGGPSIVHWAVAVRTPHVRIEAYIGTAGRQDLSEDALLVTERPTELVLAVADGVTPSSRTPQVGHVNGARYAACRVLDEVRQAPPDRDLREVFRDANHLLLREFGPGVMPELHERDRPQAAAVVTRLPLDHDGRPDGVEIVRAADCDVWVRTGGRWSLVTTTPMFRPETRAAIDDWMAHHPEASLEERLAMERTIVIGRRRWVLTALGRFREPKLRRRRIVGAWDDLVLVTDGPAVRHAVADGRMEPRDWIAALRAWEAEHNPRFKRHDDVAMLHVARAT